MRRFYSYLKAHVGVLPFAMISGGILGFSIKEELAKQQEREEWQQMQEFRNELNVNAIKGLKQDAQYIRLSDLPDTVKFHDKSGQNVIATQRDLATGLSFVILGQLEDNSFLMKYHQFKQFLEKQKAHHTERVAQYVKETKDNKIDRGTMDLIDYKFYPIILNTSEHSLRGNDTFYYTDESTYRNFLDVFQTNQAYIIGEQKSVGLLLDLNLPFIDLEQQIVGFTILQGAYIARRNEFNAGLEEDKSRDTNSQIINSISNGQSKQD